MGSHGREETPSRYISTVNGDEAPTPVATGLATPHFDRNSLINATLLLAALYGLLVGPYWLCFLWPFVLIMDDIVVFYFGGQGIFDTEIQVQRGYQFAHVFIENTSGFGRDLGFNLYDGNLNKSLDESQRDKWDYMMKKLNLRKGSKLCDIGCGYGDWLNYAKSKGVEAVGINITAEQAEYARNHYGLEIYNSNWKDILKDEWLQRKLYQRFDVITFMDTVEHYVHGKDRKNPEKQAEIYTNMFRLAGNMLDDKSENQRVFISCLHQTTGKFSVKAKICSYFLTRYHSGFYPMHRDGLTKFATKWFELEDQSDKTEDYRLTGVLDAKQFQAPTVRFTVTKLLYGMWLFLLDPHHLHKWVDIYFDCWMTLYGDDPYSLRYDPKQRAKTSAVQLWWITLKKKT